MGKGSRKGSPAVKQRTNAPRPARRDTRSTIKARVGSKGSRKTSRSTKSNSSMAASCRVQNNASSRNDEEITTQSSCIVPELPTSHQETQLSKPKISILDIAPTEDYPYIPGLDDDLALLCLARVPRSDHWKCMQLNRKFCALFNSTDLFKIRRRHGITEQWIYTFSSGQDSWQAYDPAAQRWSSLPSFEADYCYHSGDKESFTVGTQLLVVGRSADGLVTWRYDLVRNQWAKGSMMLTPRCLYAWASCGRYAYLAGGITLKGEVLQSAERYDPETERWETLPPMHERRRLCAGFLIDGKFCVLGGENEAFTPVTSGEVYDPANKTWTLLPNMLPWGGSRSFPGAPPLTAVVNNQLFVLETETNQLQLYIKSTHSWRVLGEVPVRTNLVSGWGVAFKSLGDYLLLIGNSRTAGYPDGMYVCRPDLEGGVLQWHYLRSPMGPFVYNCAVVSA